MRLASFNVLHGRSPADGRVDLPRFCAAVRALDADVLALQEVDRGQPRSAEADLTAAAAEAGGYAQHRFVPALTGLPGSWRPASDEDEDGGGGGGPAYGVALLSRLPVLAWRTVRLPALPLPVPVRFRHTRRWQAVRDEPRVAVVARLEVDGAPVTVAATHLSFLAGWNLFQLHRLARALRREPQVLLVGDLNTAAGPARWASGLRPLVCGPTYPAHGPVQQIDHVLARAGVSAGDARVWHLPLSDHRAISVDVRAGSGAPAAGAGGRWGPAQRATERRQR